MNILYPNGVLLVIPQAAQADGLANGATVFKNAAGATLATLTTSGAVILPRDTAYNRLSPGWQG